jgi:Exopolyphosphatase-related proteins
MNRIDEVLDGVKTVAIAGHVNPDGDCIGSCMGMYLYLKEKFPQIQADVYLGEMRPVFGHIKDIDLVQHQLPNADKAYDMIMLFDVSSRERIAVVEPLLAKAKKSVCVDHHITNSGIADENHIVSTASSACEVLYNLLDEEYLTLPVATAIYTGIVHDTGVFQYANTSGDTMRIAATLLDKGVNSAAIIDKSFYAKTYVQNQILGRTLMESITMFEGQCIVGVVTQREMQFYGLTPKDLDGVISQLRVTEGVEVAMFLYELSLQEFKVSMRSNEYVNVSQICQNFGGGGHIKAAGCSVHGTAHDVINNVSFYVEQALQAEKR